MSSRWLLAVPCAAAFLGYTGGFSSVVWLGHGETSAVASYLSASAAPDWGRALCGAPLFLAALLLCGVSIAGWLFVYPLVFYRFFGFGYTAGLFVSALGTKGMIPLLLCLFPSALVEGILLICAAQKALPCSVDLLQRLKTGRTLPEAEPTRYLMHGLILFQCTSFVQLWDLYPARWIKDALSDLL